MEIWTIHDVGRAYNRNRLIRLYNEDADPDRDPNIPGAVLYQSPRAVRYTADADALRADTERLAKRVAPVLRVDAGYHVTHEHSAHECIRYVTLLEE